MERRLLRMVNQTLEMLFDLDFDLELQLERDVSLPAPLLTENLMKRSLLQLRDNERLLEQEV